MITSSVSAKRLPLLDANHLPRLAADGQAVAGAGGVARVESGRGVEHLDLVAALRLGEMLQLAAGDGLQRTGGGGRRRRPGDQLAVGVVCPGTTPGEDVCPGREAGDRVV